MRVYSQVVLIAWMAVPAFCQVAAPDRVADQAKSLSDYAAQLELEAEKLAAGAETLSADRVLGSMASDEFADMQAAAADLADQAKMAFLQSPVAPKAPPAPPAAISLSADRVEALEERMARIAERFGSDDFADMQAAADLADQAEMAFLQSPVAPKAPPAPPAPPFTPRAKAIWSRGDAYDDGTRALDQHQYDEAVREFDSVIAAKSTRSDGALYWKAYALNRLGKRDDALAALAQLRRDYPTSAWLREAQALEAEVKQNAGQPVSPAQESNDDLKLMAINTLISADAERAIPLVEGILKGNSAPNVKDRALFVLSQNKSPRAQQALTDYAKGGGNPDLQLRAIQYLGMSGTKETQQQLVAIYGASSDARVKSVVLQGLMMGRAGDALLSIAKSEKDAAVRDTAIRDLTSIKSVSVESLVELYGSSDASAKRTIIDGLTGRHEAKTLVDLARKENDVAMKKAIVERLSTMRDSKDAMDYMMELLK